MNETEEEKCCEKCNGEGFDPITLDELYPEHPEHPFVVSPDGSTTICYNESTLRRIAITKRQWMQPPHFREPMVSSLQEKCEKLGGKLLLPPAASASNHYPEWYYDESFDNLLEEFVGRLSSLPVNLCPVCYEKLKKHETRSNDPLRIVLSKGISKTPLFAFADKRTWTNHMCSKHGMDKNDPEVDVEDCRLKQLIYSWISSDDPEAQKYQSSETTTRAWDESKRKRVRKVAVRSQGDLYYYWSCDGRYNVSQYNSIREKIEQLHSTTEEEKLFSNEEDSNEEGEGECKRRSGANDGDEEEVNSSESSDAGFVLDDLGNHPYNKGIAQQQRKKSSSRSSRTAATTKRGRGRGRGRRRQINESTNACFADKEDAGLDSDAQTSTTRPKTSEQIEMTKVRRRRGRRLLHTNGKRIPNTKRNGSDDEERRITRKHFQAMVITDEDDDEETEETKKEKKKKEQTTKISRRASEGDDDDDDEESDASEESSKEKQIRIKQRRKPTTSRKMCVIDDENSPQIKQQQQQQQQEQQKKDAAMISVESNISSAGIVSDDILNPILSNDRKHNNSSPSQSPPIRVRNLHKRQIIDGVDENEEEDNNNNSEKQKEDKQHKKQKIHSSSSSQSTHNSTSDSGSSTT